MARLCLSTWRLLYSYGHEVVFFWHVLLLFLALPTTTRAAVPPKCVPFAQQPIECSPYVHHHVYLPTNMTLQMLADTIRPDLAMAAKFQSETCQHAWTAFLCGTAFKKCSYADVAQTVALEHPMCYGVCRGMLSVCRGEFSLDDMEDALPNCSATLPGTDLPAYPLDSQLLSGPHNVTYKCFTPGDSNDDDLAPIVKCAPHYVPLRGVSLDDSRYPAPCQRKCPRATYSDPEYRALTVTQIVVGYFGLAFLLLVLIPFFISNNIIDNDNDNNNNNNNNKSDTSSSYSTSSFSFPLYIYIPCSMMGLGFVWPSFFGGFEHVTCEKRFIVADITYFPCAIQGIMLYWGTVSLVMWWLNVCLHLVIGSMFGIGYTTGKLRRFYAINGWIIPTIGLIIASVSKQIGASPTSVNCFLNWDAADGWWANDLFYIEFTIVVSIGFLALNIAIIRLLACYGFAGFHKQGRLIVFAYACLCIFLFMMIYWWVVEARNTHYENATDRWFDCLTVRFKAAQGAGGAMHAGGKLFDPKQDYGCVLSDRHPYGMMYTQTLIFSAVPLLVAIIFGHSWYTWNTWGTIVCSALCVAIQSLASPSSLFAMSSSSSPAVERRKSRRHHRHHHHRRINNNKGVNEVEMKDMESETTVKFMPLNNNYDVDEVDDDVDEVDDEDRWAGDQSDEVVDEDDVGGRKGRKRGGETNNFE